MADTIDESAIRAKTTAVASAMADEAILRAKVRTEVHGILTAEQQEQLKARQQEMGTRATGAAPGSRPKAAASETSRAEAPLFRPASGL